MFETLSITSETIKMTENVNYFVVKMTELNAVRMGLLDITVDFY
jgi:hypothetical protein